MDYISIFLRIPGTGYVSASTTLVSICALILMTLYRCQQRSGMFTTFLLTEGAPHQYHRKQGDEAATSMGGSELNWGEWAILASSESCVLESRGPFKI